jgi:hypothetical protein
MLSELDVILRKNFRKLRWINKMSVTNLLHDKKFVSELRAIYPARAIKPKNELLLPATHKNSSQIGIAFDYLFRIHLARQHKFRHPHIMWEVDQIARVLSSHNDFVYSGRKIAGYRMDNLQKGLGVKRIVWSLEVLKQAKVLAADYHSHGNLTDDFLSVMFKISYLEMVVRSRKEEYLDPDLINSNDQLAINELRQLFELARTSRLKVANNLFLSPRISSDFLTQGASPDLYVDDWLCDIKVVSRFGDTYRWTDQLILYAALAKLAGFDIRRTDYWNSLHNGWRYWPNLNGVAVYFARHGEWVAIPMADLVSNRSLNLVQDLICKRYLGSNKPEDIKRFKFKISK